MGVYMKSCMQTAMVSVGGYGMAWLGDGGGVFYNWPNSKWIVAGQNEVMQDCTGVSSPPADLWSPSLHCSKCILSFDINFSQFGNKS